MECSAGINITLILELKLIGQNALELRWLHTRSAKKTDYTYTRTICRFSTNINTNLNLKYPELFTVFKWRTFRPLTKLWSHRCKQKSEWLPLMSHLLYVNWELFWIGITCSSHFTTHFSLVFAEQVYVYTALQPESNGMGCSHSRKPG